MIKIGKAKSQWPWTRIQQSLEDISWSYLAERWRGELISEAQSLVIHQFRVACGFTNCKRNDLPLSVDESTHTVHPQSTHNRMWQCPDNLAPGWQIHEVSDQATACWYPRSMLKARSATPDDTPPSFHEKGRRAERRSSIEYSRTRVQCGVRVTSDATCYIQEYDRRISSKPQD